MDTDVESTRAPYPESPSAAAAASAKPAAPFPSPFLASSSPAFLPSSAPAPAERAKTTAKPGEVRPKPLDPHPSLDDLLRQGGPVPEGVADQIATFHGAQPGECPIPPVPTVAPPTTEPAVAPTLFTPKTSFVPGNLIVCLRGFSDSDPITLVVTGPDGAATTFRLLTSPDLRFGDSFFLGLGRPVGEYRIRADQGQISVTGRFTAVRPPVPVGWVKPGLVPPGSRFDFEFAGFPPNRPAVLHLYSRTRGFKIRYRAAWRLPADSSGEIRVSLPTNATTELGTYYLHHPPAGPDPIRPLVQFTVQS